MTGRSKKVVIGIVVVFGLLLIFLVKVSVLRHSVINKLSSQNQTVQEAASTNDKVEVVSTSPSPMEGSTIAPDGSLEITFSKPAVNEPGLDVKIEPSVDINLKLSDDRKTLKIWPKTTFGLSQGYSITVPSDAKFDNNATLGSDVIFHFQTIGYSGV